LEVTSTTTGQGKQMEVAGQYERGLRLLTVAKRVLALSHKLDDADAGEIRRAADQLTERGLGLVMAGAREMARELAAAKAALSDQ
jgi:hypothetical protein